MNVTEYEENVEELSGEDRAILFGTFEEMGVKLPICYWYFWDNDNMVLDGDFSFFELRAFGRAMRRMKEKHESA